MREKYESLALTELRALAKIRGIKGCGSMKKADLVDAMVQRDEEDKMKKEAAETKEDKMAVEKKDASEKKHSAEKMVSGKKDASDIKETPGTKDASEKKDASKKEYVSEKKESSDKRPSADNRTDIEKKHIGSSEETASHKSDRSHRKTGETEKINKNQRENDDRSYKEHSSNQSSDETQNSDDTKKDQESVQQDDLDSGLAAHGILEVMPDGYGFIRCENYLPGENDVYVAPSQIRRFGLKTGDILTGNTRVRTSSEKFSALLYVKTINGYTPEESMKRCNFEDMTPIFPNEKIILETAGSTVAMRLMDLICPVGKGQRGMIVSPPKAGKTTLVKEVARSVKITSPNTHLIILLIDERPEEVTDIKEAIGGPNVEVIYSTFDELPEHHKRVAEMVIERAKRLVEHKKDVMILLDSITRLTRAYNLTVPPSGRTLSGGLDPAALHMPKRFFGAARNMREGGSLTILATALVETGSKMDDVVYEEFKGTGNMEMVLDRKLSERRIFPAIDVVKSGTRREDLLLTKEEQEAVNIIRKGVNGLKPEEAVDRLIDMFSKTRSNAEVVRNIRLQRYV